MSAFLCQPGVSQKVSIEQDCDVGMWSKYLKLWCRGRDSNPHATFAAQDFKSYTDIPCRIAKSLKNQYWRGF